MYCHKCGNPILGDEFVAGDYNTFYHPVCDELERKNRSGVETMRTYYNWLYTLPTVAVPAIKKTKRNKKGK